MDIILSSSLFPSFVSWTYCICDAHFRKTSPKPADALLPNIEILKILRYSLQKWNSHFFREKITKQLIKSATKTSTESAKADVFSQDLKLKKKYTSFLNINSLELFHVLLINLWFSYTKPVKPNATVQVQLTSNTIAWD